MGVLGVFPALSKSYGFQEIWRLYNAPMPFRQADAAVICMMASHCHGDAQGALSDPAAGGREIRIVAQK
jgi:hypothetical protein